MLFCWGQADSLFIQIHGVRDYLDEHGNDSDDPSDGVENDPFNESSPALLLGMGRPVTKEEVLVDMPSRSIVDRLVSRFFKTSEPSLGMFFTS